MASKKLILRLDSTHTPAVMKRTFLLLFVFASFFAACQPAEESQQPPAAEATPPPEDPTIWEDDIAAFEAEDAATTQPENALLFIGSSSIRLWSTLKEDMAPMPVIQRGFGGSKLGDAIHYMDRIVTPYNPRAVVMFSGTNDIAGDTPKSAEAVFELYKTFVAGVQEQLPGTPIYFIAISPTKARWAHRQLVADTNAMVATHAAEQDGLFYIDTASALLDENGESREDLFVDDKLHLNADGYAVWTSIIRPELESLYPEL